MDKYMGIWVNFKIACLDHQIYLDELSPQPFALNHIKGEIILINFHEKSCLSRQLFHLSLLSSHKLNLSRRHNIIR